MSGHRPQWLDDVPTGWCECGRAYPHEADELWPRDDWERHTHFDDRDANLADCPACERAEARA